MRLRFEEADRVARHVQREKGCTFVVTENEHGAVLTTPPTGFVVGGAGANLKVIPQYAMPFPDVHLIYFFTEKCKGNAFGIWLDRETGIWHFDEVTIHDGLLWEALNLAADRKQVAVYDLALSQEIRLAEAVRA